MTNRPSKVMQRLLKAANGLHVTLNRKSGSKFASQVANLPLLLLTTCARKTGRLHTNPVAYLRDGQDYLAAASAGGMDWNPDWYFNLKSQPSATIQVGGQALNVAAVITVGDERAHLYNRFKAASPNFVKYEQNASRIIPVIRLVPNGNNR